MALKILVFHKDPACAENIKEMLEMQPGRDVEVEVVETLTEGARRIAEYPPPALIITTSPDLVLFAQELRARSKTIFIENPPSTAAELAVHPHAVIEQPFLLEALEAAVQRALGQPPPA